MARTCRTACYWNLAWLTPIRTRAPKSFVRKVRTETVSFSVICVLLKCILWRSTLLPAKKLHSFIVLTLNDTMLYLTGIIDEALCNYDIMALYNQPNHSFYGHYTGQPAFKDFVGAKFYCPHAVADSVIHISLLLILY